MCEMFSEGYLTSFLTPQSQDHETGFSQVHQHSENMGTCVKRGILSLLSLALIGCWLRLSFVFFVAFEITACGSVVHPDSKKPIL